MSELPDGWIAVQLGDLTKPTRPRCDPRAFSHLPYVGMEHVESHTRRLLGTIRATQMKSTAFHFQPGDILYGRLRPYLNKVLCPGFEGLCSSEFIVLSSNASFDSRFLAPYLTTDRFVSFANGLNQGDRPRVKFDQIAKYEIPLPPLKEQRRIVVKLEELVSKVEACQKRLAKIPVILKLFRQSVIDAACAGRLTADWRDAQPSLSSADALLSRINSDFEPVAPDAVGLENLPDGWVAARFGVLVDSIRGGSTAVPTHQPTDFPILRSSSVRPGFVDLEDVKYLGDEESRNEMNYLMDGDLLFTRLSGSIDYVANCAKVRSLGGRRIQYPDRLFRAKVDAIDTSFCELIFSAPFVRKLITERAKSSAGHQRVSIGDITQQPIPIASLEEQREIVCRVEGLFKIADRIEEHYKTGQAQIDKVPQSILAKAFRGELVPTEAKLAKGRSP
jgi:type I restriction enzyme, S subunit